VPRNRTHDERKYRMLNIDDEFTCAALGSCNDYRLGSSPDVLDTLADLLSLKSVAKPPCLVANASPSNIRLDYRLTCYHNISNQRSGHGQKFVGEASFR